MAPKTSTGKGKGKEDENPQPAEPHVEEDLNEFDPDNFDPEIFKTSQAYTEFRKYWGGKAAAVERKIELFSFGEGFGLEQEFRRRGWVQLAKTEGTYVLTLCAELMANISLTRKNRGSEKIVSWVRGKNIEITPESFCKFYGIKREPNPEFYHGVGNRSLQELSTEILANNLQWVDGKPQMEKKLMKLRYLPLFLFSLHNLLPLARKAQLSLPRAQLMWAIGKKKVIDLPRYMFLQLYNDANNLCRGGSIPFVCMLTQLIREARVQPPPFLTAKSSISSIGFSSLKRSEGQYKSHGKRQRGSDDEEAGESSKEAGMDLDAPAMRMDDQAQQASLDKIIGMLELQALTQKHHFDLLEAHTKAFGEFREDVVGRFDRIEKEQKQHSQAIEELQREIERTVWQPEMDD